MCVNTYVNNILNAFPDLWKCNIGQISSLFWRWGTWSKVVLTAKCSFSQITNIFLTIWDNLIQVLGLGYIFWFLNWACCEKRPYCPKMCESKTNFSVVCHTLRPFLKEHFHLSPHLFSDPGEENAVAAWGCYPRFWGAWLEALTGCLSSPASAVQGLTIKAGVRGPLDSGFPAGSFCPSRPWFRILLCPLWRDSSWSHTYHTVHPKDQNHRWQRKAYLMKLLPLRSRKTWKRALSTKTSWRSMALSPHRMGSSSSCIQRTICVNGGS